MRPIWKSTLMQIEVTNACINQCANCTRMVGHHKKVFFMDLDTIRKSIDNLEGFPGGIGLMGGEPTLHPQFREICKIYQEKIPDKTKRELWTSGYKWKEYEDIILETFDKERISYNEHSTDGGVHQPLLVAMKEIVKDKKLRQELKDNCWVQHRWACCSITPYGVYLCEILGAMDILFNEGKNAIPNEPGWWKNTEPFLKQQKVCDLCGAPVPIGGMSDRATFDLISKGNLKKLKDSPRVLAGNYAEYNKKWTKEEIIKKSYNWKPWNWRNFYAHCPDDYQGKNTTTN